MKDNKVKLTDSIIISKIHIMRGHKVMLDEDLAELYEVPTKRINEQVKRNNDRFPEDFMFELTKEEFENLKSQNATARWGGRRTPPYAFTEHGVLMLSSVLKSEKAININIQIMRLFTKMRELLMSHQELILKLQEIENRLSGHDEEFDRVFTHLLQLIEKPNPPRERIGFKRNDEQ